MALKLRLRFLRRPEPSLDGALAGEHGIEPGIRFGLASAAPCQSRSRCYQGSPQQDNGKFHTLLDPSTGLAYLTPMAVRPILIAPDPRLKAVSANVEKVDHEIRKLAEDMADSMYAADGIGLAAVQIGVPKRVIVMDLDQKDGKKDWRVFINPKILWASEELAIFEEGCLSVPEIWDDVERPARIRAEYIDLDGKRVEMEADGMLATCLQHEMDHLEGVLFIDHLSRLKRGMALKKLAKAKKLAS
jgi:peptide deformylase